MNHELQCQNVSQVGGTTDFDLKDNPNKLNEKMGMGVGTGKKSILFEMHLFFCFSVIYLRFLALTKSCFIVRDTTICLDLVMLTERKQIREDDWRDRTE